jgi:D-glycero-D-manno-heptose 1,7-bisphosphate phosphatase
MTIKTIFLDRDGVINQEVNYLYKIENFKFIDGIFSACRYVQNIGYDIIIVTNQSGISRGFYSENEYDILCEWMLSKFNENRIEILDIFHCPHSPESRCECRKPKPGMFIAAKNKHSINMKESWMIGDSERDITAASLAGIKNTILVRSGHKIDEKNSHAKYYLNSIKDISNAVKF